MHYEGTFKNDDYDGIGSYTSIIENIKTTYEGNFIKNKPEGYGISKIAKILLQLKTIKNNTIIEVEEDKLFSIYEGQHKNKMRNGYGELKTEDYFYKGNWLNNKKIGYGILTKSNGYKFKGYFLEDKKEGNGSEICPNIPDEDGNISGSFEGFFRDDMRYYGTLTLSNGKKYTGYFKDNMQNGKGLLTYPNGDTYEGEFKKGIPYGEGTETLLIEEEVGIQTFKEFKALVKGKSKFRVPKKEESLKRRNFYFDNKLIYKGIIKERNNKKFFKIISINNTEESEQIEVEKLLQIGTSKLLLIEKFEELTEEKIYDTTCIICQNEYINGDLLLLSKCNGENSKCHAFHLECGILLFINNNKCPICRKVVYEKDIVRNANINRNINDDEDLDLYS